MTYSFSKMHGAGNDFVLVDDRDERFPADDDSWLRELADRRRGIGCDGFILIQPAEDADFRMRFHNPDGYQVEMCANGARCAARFAYAHGFAGTEMRIATVAGMIRAKIEDDLVRLYMTPPEDCKLRTTIAGHSVHSINTGVPHVVVVVEDVAAADLLTIGRELRNHRHFAPAGTNVNLVAVHADGLAVRTYERGVEDETQACGTGVVASALIARELGNCQFPIDVRTAGGDVLTVAGTGQDVSLTGPAVTVFEGILTHQP
ncbi:MAG: diaminopimelate epimerase [Rhodothermales bacterium]|jgi:diaminopimelate epimerase